ncbi:MAG: DUF1080 domain-containing protein [Cyclobacteriaceae bacterium]
MLPYTFSLCLLVGIYYPASSQDNEIPFTRVNLQNLNEFKPVGKNWKIADDVFYDFKEGGKTNINPGTGILVNDLSGKDKNNIFTVMEHGDIEIELDFMMDKNSNAGIYFQSRYEIQLFDSWGVKNPKYQDCGAIYERWDDTKPEGRKGFEGHPPAQNVSKAPGLWQHFKIYFRAPRFDEKGFKTENARFIKVIQNGVIIHENVEVTGPTRAAFFQDEKPLGPLMIQGDHGPVAIRNILYKAYGLEKVTLSGIKIAAYEGKFKSLSAFRSISPTKEMSINTLAHTGTDTTDYFAGKITGTMHIPKTGPYYFHLNLKWIPTVINSDKPNGGGEFLLDNKKVLVIDGGKSGFGSTIIELKAGDYPWVLSYFKSQKFWYVPTDDIVLAVEAPGIAYTTLNPAFKTLDAVGAIRVAVNGEPVMLRSFVDHNGKKKTHVLSVGEPGKLNYTVDLSSGGFLQLWRGDFTETTQMWYGRGEPQLALPLGSVISFSGKPSVAFLQDKNEAWPDSSAQYNYIGYDVDQAGRPVFKYALGNTQVRDFFEGSADGKKLKHSINIKTQDGAKTLWCLVAQGNDIIKMPNGLYSVNKEFFIEFAGKQQPVIRKTSSNMNELLLPIGIADNAGSITYSIIW